MYEIEWSSRANYIKIEDYDEEEILLNDSEKYTITDIS